MVDVLRGPARGPEGDDAPAGAPIPKNWPKWFIDDLREIDHIVDQDEFQQAQIAEKRAQAKADAIAANKAAASARQDARPLEPPVKRPPVKRSPAAKNVRLEGKSVHGRESS